MPKPRKPAAHIPPSTRNPACTGCKYDSIGEGFVPGEGPIGATVAIIGEAPGADEVRTGRPFIGRAGKQLDELLVGAGLHRPDIFITNTVKCRPPANKTPTLDWIRTCKKRHLDGEIAGLSPHVIGLLGNVPLAAFGRSNRSNASEISGILKWEGSIFPITAADGRQLKAMALLHPAALMTYKRLRKRLPISRKFYSRLAQQSRTAHYPPEDWELVTDCDSTFPLWVKQVQEGKRAIAFDIETSGGSFRDCDILCISFSDGKVSYSIPWEDPCVTDGTIGGLLADTAVPKITQNGVFDISVLALHGVPVHGPILDTCYLHHVHFMEIPHSLAFLTSVYTWIPFYKDETKDADGKSQDFADIDPVVLRSYNARDSLTQYRCAAGIRKEVTQSKWDFYRKIVQPLIPAVADMQATGIAVDALARSKLADSLRTRIEHATLTLQELGVPRVSRKELRTLIFEKWGIEPIARTAVRGEGKVDEALFKYILRAADRAPEIRSTVQALSQYFSVEKLLSTFVTGLRVDNDGRARGSWSIHGTRTGRLSCIAKGSPIEVVRDVSQYPKGIPIEEVRPGDLAYAYRNGELGLYPVTAVISSGKCPVIRLRWIGTGKHTNGQLLLTPDHKVLLTSGQWREAKDLIPGDRVYSLSRSTNLGYARLWPTGSAEIAKEHRFIYHQTHGWTPEAVHHLNHNKLDNRIENLAATTRHEHMTHHPATPKLREARRLNGKKRFSTGWKMPHPQPKPLPVNTLTVLEQERYSIVRAAQRLGRDFNSFKMALERRGINTAELKAKAREMRRDEILQRAANAREYRLREYRLRNNHTITAIEPAGELEVYDLSVDTAECFIASEICVHNCKNPNLQNQPDEVRHIFVPGAGHVFVSVDYSAFEAWGMALLADEPRMLEILRSGRDFHLAMLADTFREDYDQLFTRYQQGDPHARKLRDMRKHTTYAGQYGAGPDKLHEVMCAEMDDPPTIDEVRLMHQRDRITYPNVARFKADVETQLRRDRKLVGPFGRERFFLGIPDDVLTNGYDYPIQNLAAEVVNQVHTDLYERVGPGIICAQGHDSFLLNTPVPKLQATLAHLRCAAGRPFTFPNWWGKSVTHAFNFEIRMGMAWDRQSLKLLPS